MEIGQAGRVTGREIKNFRDRERPTRLLQVEITAPEDVQTVEHLTQSGEDTSPPDNAQVVIYRIGEAWKIAVSTDDHVEPSALPGEKKLYSTDHAGEVEKCKIHLKQDGEIELNNDAVNIRITPDGDILFTADRDMIGNVLNSTMTATEDIEKNANNITLAAIIDFIVTAQSASIETTGNTVVNAAAIQLNGTSDNLTMWTVLNSALQGLITALNSHTHSGSALDQVFSVDIDGAKANTLQTDG